MRPLVASPLRAAQIGVTGTLLGLAAGAWLLTDQLTHGMKMAPRTDLGPPTFYVGAWLLMTAAMMFPSAAPMVIVFSKMRGGRATGVFVAGYLLAWTAFGLAAYLLLTLLRSLSIDALAWDERGPYVAGGVVVAGAIYQLTPPKNVCLSRCRGPLAFILGAWRQGLLGALRMGVEHGLFCVGCCWALMATLFALGAMDVRWMAFVAGLIAVEKMLPWRRLATGSVTLQLVALGLAVTFVPERVPGLE